MIRPDWTLSKNISDKINLSSNVCYDNILIEEINKLQHNVVIDLRNYPDESKAYKALSEFYNQDPYTITLGYGLSEIIVRLLNIFKDKTISIVSPTWAAVEAIGKANGNLLYLNEYEDKADVVYIANPNGRSGELFTNDEIYNHLCDKHEYVIIDEAYHDFSQTKSSLYERPDNLIVLKTLSKSLSLAGIRCGYAFANKDITLKLQEIRPAYVTSAFVNETLEYLLPMIDGHTKRMIETRDYLEYKYDCKKSYANFVLFEKAPDFTKDFEVKKIDGYTRMSLLNKELII